YAFDGRFSVLGDTKNLGINADIASMMTPDRSPAALTCFQGCPYTNTVFDVDVRICQIEGRTVVLQEPKAG
ncbi:MAG: hypothetical protein IJA71_10830, partial [Clostridia bacterium]|nr:hypothetical protein [Clostridia bacterium]